MDPRQVSVRDARDAYLAENGFTVEAYDAPWTDASFLGIRFAVPNTQNHRWAIRMHDLHHVATGYGTDLAGEGEISAWELRRGLAPLGWYVGAIVCVGALVGFLWAPRRTLAAFRTPGPKRSLFHRERPYAELIAADVAALRADLGLPVNGLARIRALHAYAPRRRASLTATTP